MDKKVYETEPFTRPNCRAAVAIISFIDQPDVIKKILQHLGLWEESHTPPIRDLAKREIIFDPSYASLAFDSLLGRKPLLVRGIFSVEEMGKSRRTL
jgi:hypothetical protein